MIWPLLCLVFWQDPQPEIPDQAQVESALKRHSDTWWDNKNNDIKRVDLPKKKRDRQDGFTSFPLIAETAIFLAKVVAVLVIIGLFAVIVLTIIRARRLVEFDVEEQTQQEFVKLRRHLLPDELRDTQGDLLMLAKQARKGGHIREAFAFLFGHVLLTFDASHLLVLDRSKTNYTYIRELGNHANQSFFKKLVHGFEDHFFGPNPQDGEAWDTLLGEYNLIHREQSHV